MARLDFLWQLQARDEKLDMEALQVNICSSILIISLSHSFNRWHVHRTHTVYTFGHFHLLLVRIVTYLFPQFTNVYFHVLIPNNWQLNGISFCDLIIAGKSIPAFKQNDHCGFQSPIMFEILGDKLPLVWKLESVTKIEHFHKMA